MKPVSLRALALGVVLGAPLLAGSPAAPPPEVVAAAPVSVAAGLSMHDVLQAAKEKDLRVVVVLRSGTQYAAQVKDVGAQAVVLENPSGKEFFEVYVVQSEIAAIEVRVHDR
jgi:hypothetical protein